MSYSGWQIVNNQTRYFVQCFIQWQKSVTEKCDRKVWQKSVTEKFDRKVWQKSVKQSVTEKAWHYLR